MDQDHPERKPGARLPLRETNSEVVVLAVVVELVRLDAAVFELQTVARDPQELELVRQF